MKQVLIALGILSCTASCVSRDFVTVTDATTAMPISRAAVSPIYPSFGGQKFYTDKTGAVQINGFGLPRRGYGVRVEAPGHKPRFIPTYTTSKNHEGWNENNIQVALEPTTRP
jgi:hypothetical protein